MTAMKTRAERCLQTRKQSVLKGVLRLNNAAAARLLWDTTLSSSGRIPRGMRPFSFAYCPQSRRSAVEESERAILFRSKAQVRRHSGSISRACNAALEQIRPVPTGVLSAAAPLDLFRFGVVKMLDDAPCVASAFHLAKSEKSLA